MPTREEMLNEAIARMKKLDLHPNTITELKNGVINVSKQFGALYWADEAEKEMIRKFEAEHNALVFHCIENHTNFGTLFSMLFVSQYEEEWEIDNEDLNILCPIAMVKNRDDDMLSDMGCIKVKPFYGGLVRIA